jgi:hypothetical protein
MSADSQGSAPGLTRGDQRRQQPAAALNGGMNLRRQPTAGTADPMINRLDTAIRVIRRSPLCRQHRCGGPRPHADAPARPSSQSRPPSPPPRCHQPSPPTPPQSDPTSHRRHTGVDVSTPSSTDQKPPADHATAHRYATDTNTLDNPQVVLEIRTSRMLGPR